ncbi:MAG: hypothetical protein WBB19_00005, partial [Desulforhopalus sp.]
GSPEGNSIRAGGFNHRCPNRDLRPEGTPSKKSKPACARDAIQSSLAKTLKLTPPELMRANPDFS